MLVDLLEEYRGCPHEEAEAYLRDLLDQGRYQRDIWS